MSSVTVAEHRDLRSEAHGFKRDKDHNAKWMNGIRAPAGVKGRWVDTEGIHFHTGSEAKAIKIRPDKRAHLPDYHKSHANKTPKASGNVSSSFQEPFSMGRHARKADALIDAKEHSSSNLSKSLLDLLPQHVNNNFTSIRTSHTSDDSAIAGILYSFDSKNTSPNANGRTVDLGGLVEQAEKKFLSRETDKIVQGEYEVLDIEGETTLLTTAKKGRKGSPKQKVLVVPEALPVEDDGFELI